MGVGLGRLWVRREEIFEIRYESVRKGDKGLSVQKQTAGLYDQQLYFPRIIRAMNFLTRDFKDSGCKDSQN